MCASQVQPRLSQLLLGHCTGGTWGKTLHSHEPGDLTPKTMQRGCTLALAMRKPPKTGHRTQLCAPPGFYLQL